MQADKGQRTIQVGPSRRKGVIRLAPRSGGESVGALIRRIHRNLLHFGTKNLPSLLGLLEDWKASVNWQNPTPDAAREACLIAPLALVQINYLQAS
jgi:hypothetical protein